MYSAYLVGAVCICKYTPLLIYCIIVALDDASAPLSR